jgi:Tfp pilus assembly protein FimT
MRRAFRGDSGVTLSELMVVVTLTGIIGSIVTAAATTGLRQQTKVQDRTDALAQARTTLQRTGRDIRSASSIATARDDTLVLIESQSTVTRTMTYSLVADGSRYDLVVDESDVSASTGAALTAPPRRILQRNLVNTSATPVFSYSPTSTYASLGTAGVNATTCAITGSSPKQYAQQCIGTITLHLLVQPSSLSAAIDVSDNGTELRNAS